MAITPPITNAQGAIFSVSDIEGDSANQIDFGTVLHGLESNNISVVFPTQSGWNLMGIPIFLNSITYGHDAKPGYSANDIVAPNGLYDVAEFCKNHLYEFENDTVPIHYKYENDHVFGGLVSRLLIVKDYLGSAYIQEFSFNGIGNFEQLEGYQYKVTTNYYWKYTGTPLYNTTSNSVEMVQTYYTNGWKIFGFPYLYEVSADFYFSDLVEQDLLVIAKSNTGTAFLPEWNFNGIGNLKPGQGYQVKIKNV